MIVCILLWLIILLLIKGMQIKKHHFAQLQRLAWQHQLDLIQTIKESREQEREFIAHKLHNEVGAILSIAKLNIEQLKQHVFAADNEAMHKLQTTQKLLSDMSDTVRGISHRLMPLTLEKFGIKAAVLDLLTCINAANKIKVEEVLKGLDDTHTWSKDFCLKFYGILQEILNNTIKHSAASHVLVQIIQLENSVTLYVEDNGKGLQKENKEGFGLRWLRSNVGDMKGIMEINGVENHGTFIFIELPLPIDRQGKKTLEDI